MLVRSLSIVSALLSMPVAALAQNPDPGYRSPATHDELFGVQGYVEPSPAPNVRQSGISPGTRLNPPLGGYGSISVGRILTRQVGPGDNNQAGEPDFGSHDDLQYSPRLAEDL